MAITSGFFDSVDDDRLYTAEQMSSYFDGIVSNGVYENIGQRLVVASANDGMKISVGTGRAIIQSHWMVNDTPAELTLDPADVSGNRIDAIVLRLDMTARAISLTVKKGTATSGSPSMPAITRTATVYELYLASVAVQKGATQPGMITDLRPSSYCGWVTGVIQQVDTSDLFAQWNAAYQQQFAAFQAYCDAREAAFNAWFEALTSTLNVDTSIQKLERYDVIQRTEYAGTLFEIGIADFNRSTDILEVYVNGARCTDGTDYAGDLPLDIGPFFVFEDDDFISLNKTLHKNDVLTFVVLHNVIALPGRAITGDAYTVLSGGIAETITGIAETEEEA